MFCPPPLSCPFYARKFQRAGVCRGNRRIGSLEEEFLDLCGFNGKCERLDFREWKVSYPSPWIGQTPVAQSVELRTRSVVVPDSIPSWGDGRFLHFSVSLPSRRALSLIFSFLHLSHFYSLLVSSSQLLCVEETVGSALWRRSPSNFVNSKGSLNDWTPEGEKSVILHRG